jgi:hypothetical protein
MCNPLTVHSLSQKESVCAVYVCVDQDVAHTPTLCELHLDTHLPTCTHSLTHTIIHPSTNSGARSSTLRVCSTNIRPSSLQSTLSCTGSLATHSVAHPLVSLGSSTTHGLSTCSTVVEQVIVAVVVTTVVIEAYWFETHTNGLTTLLQPVVERAAAAAATQTSPSETLLATSREQQGDQVWSTTKARTQPPPPPQPQPQAQPQSAPAPLSPPPPPHRPLEAIRADGSERKRGGARGSGLSSQQVDKPLVYIYSADDMPALEGSVLRTLTECEFVSMHLQLPLLKKIHQQQAACLHQVWSDASHCP